jgi:hypothetical protein
MHPARARAHTHTHTQNHAHMRAQRIAIAGCTGRATGTAAAVWRCGVRAGFRQHCRGDCRLRAACCVLVRWLGGQVPRGHGVTGAAGRCRIRRTGGGSRRSGWSAVSPWALGGLPVVAPGGVSSSSDDSMTRSAERDSALPAGPAARPDVHRIRAAEADPHLRRDSPTSAPGLAHICAGTSGQVALLRTRRDVLPCWLYYGTGQLARGRSWGGHKSAGASPSTATQPLLLRFAVRRCAAAHYYAVRCGVFGWAAAGQCCNARLFTVQGHTPAKMTDCSKKLPVREADLPGISTGRDHDVAATGWCCGLLLR